jgi:hypothetical protein
MVSFVFFILSFFHSFIFSERSLPQTARGGERGKHSDDDLHDRAPRFLSASYF